LYLTPVTVFVRFSSVLTNALYRPLARGDV